MALDLGGLAKEYAVDRACEILRASGVKNALLNFAGDVAAVGPKGDGSPWQVGIAHPRHPKGTFDAVGLYRGALATSGDYERFKIVDGIRYCHILNPITGYPTQEVHSVSVLAESCLVAGALSTIGMLLGWENGQHHLQTSGSPSLFIREQDFVAHQWPGKLTQKSSEKPLEDVVGGR
jgi:thiamine biosynthesis lipoprotein